MHRISLMIALLVFAPLAALATEPPPGDLGKLQGKWKGMAGPEKNISVILEFKDGDVTVSVLTPDGQEMKFKGKAKVDEKADPKAIDLVEFSSSEGDSLPDNKSLYQIDGEVLKLCTGKPNSDRPKEFKEDKDAEIAVITLMKVKE